MRKAKVFLCIFVTSWTVQARPPFLGKYASDPYSVEKWKYCGLCHVDPGGGGYGAPLTVFGEGFKDNGYRVTDELRKLFPDRFSSSPARSKSASAGTMDAFTSWELAGSQPLSLSTDSNGIVWIGDLSKGSILKLDTFTNEIGEVGIPVPCHDVVVDSRDGVWYLATEKKEERFESRLGIWDPYKGETEEFRVPENGGRTSSMAYDSAREVIWINYFSGFGLLKFSAKGGEWTKFEDTGAAKRPINGSGGLTVDQTGTVWYVRGDEIVRFDVLRETFRSYGLPSEWRNSAIASAEEVSLGITYDKENNIWVAFPGLRAIVKLNATSGIFEKYLIPCDDDGASGRGIPSDIVADSRDRIWFTDLGCGTIWVFDPETKVFEEIALPGGFELGPKIHLDAWEGIWVTSPRIGRVARVDAAER